MAGIPMTDSEREFIEFVEEYPFFDCDDMEPLPPDELNKSGPPTCGGTSRPELPH